MKISDLRYIIDGPVVVMTYNDETDEDEIIFEDENGLYHLPDKFPDLIVASINHGANATIISVG